MIIPGSQLRYIQSMAQTTTRRDLQLTVSRRISIATKSYNRSLRWTPDLTQTRTPLPAVPPQTPAHPGRPLAHRIQPSPKCQQHEYDTNDGGYWEKSRAGAGRRKAQVNQGGSRDTEQRSPLDPDPHHRAPSPSSDILSNNDDDNSPRHVVRERARRECKRGRGVMCMLLNE